MWIVKWNDPSPIKYRLTVQICSVLTCEGLISQVTHWSASSLMTFPDLGFVNLPPRWSGCNLENADLTNIRIYGVKTWDDKRAAMRSFSSSGSGDSNGFEKYTATIDPNSGLQPGYSTFLEA